MNHRRPMVLAVQVLAWSLALLAAVAVQTSSALAAHLPAGRETEVKALIFGPELAELGLEVQSVAIQRTAIAVVVAGAASGVLHLEEQGASPQAFAKGPSFALRWTSAQPGTPPVIQTWAGRIAARDAGGWWVAEVGAPPPRQAPALAWSVAVGGVLWLLLLLGLLVGPAPAKVLAWSLLAVSMTAATQWLLARSGLSHAAREAMAGRSGSPLAALAALWRWHFHVPEGLVDGASAALSGLLLGTALPRRMLSVPLLRELPAVGMAAVAALAGAVSLATVGLYHSLGVSLVALCLAVPPRGAALPQWLAAAALLGAQLGWLAFAAP